MPLVFPIPTGGGGGGSSQTYITYNNETGTLPNSRRLIAGSGMTFTPGAGTLTLDSASGASTLLQYAYVTKSANYTVDLATDAMIEVDASGGAVVITLPSATVPNKGKGVIIKKGENSVNTVTITTTGGQLIDDDATSFVLASEDQANTFISTGGGWSVL